MNSDKNPTRPTPVHGRPLFAGQLLRLLLPLGNYLLRNEVALEDGGQDHAADHCKFRPAFSRPILMIRTRLGATNTCYVKVL